MPAGGVKGGVAERSDPLTPPAILVEPTDGGRPLPAGFLERRSNVSANSAGLGS
jgi:hypothetical protein